MTASYKSVEPFDCFLHPEEGGRYGASRLSVAKRISEIQPIDASILSDARTLHPPLLPPGTVVYIDPPYKNTTGYGHKLPREEVVLLARRWAEAGATVAISEAEPIADLVAERWYSVDITDRRVGQKRTFSKQQSEYLTLNR